MTCGATQRTRILELLLSAGGDWVPLPKILELKISQFGARILELRRSGFNIENRTETVNDQRQSWYRLVPKYTSQAEPELSVCDVLPPVNAPQVLFANETTWRDPEEGWR